MLSLHRDRADLPQNTEKPEARAFPKKHGDRQGDRASMLPEACQTLTTQGIFLFSIKGVLRWPTWGNTILACGLR